MPNKNSEPATAEDGRVLDPNYHNTTRLYVEMAEPVWSFEPCIMSEEGFECEMKLKVIKVDEDEFHLCEPNHRVIKTFNNLDELGNYCTALANRGMFHDSPLTND